MIDELLDRLTRATRDEALCAVAQVAGVDGVYLLSQAEARTFTERGCTLLVPLHEASGYAAVGFFWQSARTLDPQSALELQRAAKIIGLAARTWSGDARHAQQLREERRDASELQHRLRNNLALMRSVIRRSNETAESAEDFALHLDARIGALARTQGLLAATGGAGVELEELVRMELIASAVHENRYRVEGPGLRLLSKAAESLGLTLHELATNSLKYGALAAEGGLLAVGWTVTGGAEPELRLSWMESGVTIVSLAPRRRGFGQELIEHTLPYEFNARTRLAFKPGGAYCTIFIPLAACAAQSVAAAPQQPARAGRQ